MTARLALTIPPPDQVPVRLPSEQLTEDYAAILFAQDYQDMLLYCRVEGTWYEWDGTCWMRDQRARAFHFARLLVRRLAREQDERVRCISGKTNFAAGVERFAQADPAFVVTPEELDRDPFLLGTPDGTVDLRTGKLHQAKPKDRITRKTSVGPADDSKCPIWRSFLHEATGGDSETIRFLKQWAGYCLTGDTREHTLLFVVGPGGNGKSVFLNTLIGILADYAVTAPMDIFASSRSDRHPTELAMLRGARFVAASETHHGRNWHEARIKELTGGDRISARFMRKDFFSFVPHLKLTLVGNHEPNLIHVDEAMRRRLNFVRFDVKPTKPDRELQTKLRGEWPAILAWMVEGCLDWQRNGLLRPNSVKVATETYFGDQDFLTQWLDAVCEVDHNNSSWQEKSAALYRSWRAFAEAGGEEAGSSKAFAQKMRSYGFRPFRNANARGYAGIRLTNSRHDK